MVGSRAGYDALDCLPALIYNKNPPKRIAVSSGPNNNNNQCAGNVPRHEPDDLPHDLPPFYASVRFPLPYIDSGSGGRFRLSLAGAGVFGGVGG
jgi:hypothetical protein